MNVMLDHIDHADLEPVFFAPFVSSVMRVEPDWIDYNGHLNMAWYNVLFDRAFDEVLALIGAGPAYVDQQRHSYYTAETHVRYLRELKAGDAVRATVQLLDCDAKRMHYFVQLFHATEAWMAATAEVMALHVDMTAQKTAPIPPEIAERLADLEASHARLPCPEAAGRRIAMPHRSA
ncbi:3-hydroxyacyl-CoA dehydrogenase [Rhodovulum sp. PH10]|uniref:thioesterase family protein n=1 Tax=Rhodovulum sp. PH10 TaxID=1187851 RepID=UPI00027C2424|nr:thioesterase family protein [Rhodovulum sp. PH10]EJW09280.1 3-hydroxyacyl-CoA dehydrogenase [Rhodovulum sp. PH10]